MGSSASGVRLASVTCKKAVYTFGLCTLGVSLPVMLQVPSCRCAWSSAGRCSQALSKILPASNRFIASKDDYAVVFGGKVVQIKADRVAA